MKGFYTAQEAHVVSLVDPVDWTGGKTGRWISLAKYEHCTILISIGVAAAAMTSIQVEAAQNVSGGGAVAIPFNVFKAETANVDLFGARVAVPAAGFAPANQSHIMYAIEIDTSEINVDAGAGEGFPYITVVATNGGNSVIASAIAVLSGARFAGDQSPTVNA
jgi:hypothetical protein